MQLWAIRQHGTTNYMPERAKRTGSYTWYEFEPFGGRFGPRLFVSARGARQAAQAWKRGKYEQTFIRTHSSFGEDERSFVQIIPDTARNSRLEIVSFQLVEEIVLPCR